MRMVRMSGNAHAIDLQGKAKRLVDWKEYVKAKPILSVASVSLLGFGLVRNLMLAAPKPSPSSPTRQPTRSNTSPLKTTLSFIKNLPRTEAEHGNRLQPKRFLKEEDSAERVESATDSLDLARQYIAARPTTTIAIAFAIGGALGWLTSRR
jgi:hypothetical protein